MASTAATAAANLSISKPSPTLSFQSLTSHSRLILPGSKAKITVSVAHRITASLSDPKPKPSSAVAASIATAAPVTTSPDTFTSRFAPTSPGRAAMFSWKLSSGRA
ncbi:hypothetical protein CK203_067648 [Vitis vinifera]|uniref:Uncharacterized protein n=1 Tax=Vitis vinifera TaxID=29760 RepID=A0A438EB92_VITVI|nr:hypothetical protein CK203_067648 [Vitis vinifera]